MRIVLVNWARIWDGASHGGGVNGYCQTLALALLKRGHEVVYLCGGTTFVPAPGSPTGADDPGPCAVRRHDDWLGVRVFEVINSPVSAPSIVQFREPLAEVAAPALERALAEFFGFLRPDIVHFHNIEGFSAGCIDAARSGAVGLSGTEQRGDSTPEWRGARVLYSLHNYHTVCPQVYLMQGHRRVCTDYDNGHCCTRCIEAVDPAVERRRLARIYRQTNTPEPSPPAPLPPPRFVLLRQLIGEVKSGLTPPSADDHPPPPPTPPAPLGLPGAAVDSPRSVGSPHPAPAPDTRGKTQHLLGELSPKVTWRPDDPECQPVLNVIAPEPPSDKPPNDYARRRHAMVAMLNRCDRVLAVSDFVRRKFEALGVSPARIGTLHIGSRVNDVVARHAELLFDPPPLDPAHPRPIRLAFMGYNNWYKGLGMLIDSLELLTPEYLRRIHLFVYALDGQTIEWRFRRIEPRLGGLLLHHGYEYHDIPWMLGGKDLGLVTSVWWDNAPQTVFEFFACAVPVLAAEVGGIPDFVKDGHNGLLFRGNDRYDLARRIAEVLDHPQILDRLRKNVRPPKGIDEHAGELEEVYGACLSSSSVDDRSARVERPAFAGASPASHGSSSAKE